MLKDFETYRWRLVCLLLGGLLVSSSLPAQFLSWNYYNILDEVRESGSRPDMVIAPDGSFHITYWQEFEDKLIYTFQDPQNGWVREYIDFDRSNGYVNSLSLDQNGIPHVLFMENDNGIARYRYAFRTGPDNWIIENIPDDPVKGWGEYGPNAPLVATHRLQHGADLEVQADGTPQVIFFNGWMEPNSFPSCTNSSTYDLRLMQATKFGNQWLVRDFGEIPDIHQSCGTSDQPFPLPTGDRYGEFPFLLQRNNGDLEALCVSKFNNHVLRYQTLQNDTSWSYNISDYIFDRLDSLTYFWTPEFYTFQGISAAVDQFDNVHLAYGSSFNYGENFAFLALVNELVYQRPDDPDSVFQVSFGVSGSYTYRNFTDLEVRHPDSIYLVYSDLSKFQLLMWESIDSGQTWTQDTILPILTTAQSPTQIHGDSIYVLAYDAERARLRLGRRSLGGGEWFWEDLTTSQNHGQSLDGEVVALPTDTVGHLAFNDSYNGSLFYASGSSSGNWNYAIEELPNAGGEANAVSMTLGPQQEPVLAFAAGEAGDARVATKINGVWKYETVGMGVNALFTDIALSGNDTLHLVYYSGQSDRLFHRTRYFYENGSRSWDLDLIDCDSIHSGSGSTLALDATECDTLQRGLWPSLVMDGEVPHVAYYDETGLQLKYAYKPQGSGWLVDTVNSNVPSSVGRFCSLKLNSQGLPRIAYLDDQNTAVLYSERSAAGTWTHSIVDSSQVTNIGRPTELVLDQFDNPWIAYNFNFNFDRAKLMHRDTIWREVAVSSQGQIASEFHLDIIGGDLYLLGKKSELQNTGLAMLYAPNGVFVQANEATDLDQLVEFKAFPNPFQDVTTFRLQLEKPQVLSLQIFDLNGRQVGALLDHQKLNPGLHEFSWDANGLAPGIYFCTLNNGHSQTVKKLVIAN